MRLYITLFSLRQLKNLLAELKACFIPFLHAEISIPIEIKKLGEGAIKVYWEALREGEEKIPYCSMLILGDEKVGKTSLYRQLVGKNFEREWCKTRGIDNNTVDTVDRRALDLNEWEEKNSPDVDGGFVKALSKKLVENLYDGDTKEEVSEKELLERIMGTVKKIKRRRLPSSTHLPTSASLTDVQKKDDILEPKLGKKNPPLQEHRKTPPNADATPLDATHLDATPSDATPSDVTPSDATPTKVPPNATESHAMLNRRQSSKLDIALKKRAVDGDLSLVLNTLDFAGQKLYRPMHHCFISRQALYIVVFKIPDILDETLRKKSLEEVRYWIHSIHSHIYLSEEDMKREDKKIKQVFLVGTHRGDHSGEDLKIIDEIINAKLVEDDDRCCNHIIYPVGGVSKYFIPVENEIDHNRSRDYLRDSGTGVVQNLVKTTSKTLPFLNKKHPIKWLLFEERLKKKMKTISTTPVVTIKGVKDLAIISNITSEKQQKLALKFFHDTRKIICISELL